MFGFQSYCFLSVRRQIPTGFVFLSKYFVKGLDLMPVSISDDKTKNHMTTTDRTQIQAAIVPFSIRNLTWL